MPKKYLDQLLACVVMLVTSCNPVMNVLSAGCHWPVTVKISSCHKTRLQFSKWAVIKMYY